MGTPATLPANFSGFDEDKSPAASGANAPQSLPSDFNGFDEDKQSSPAAPSAVQPYTMENGRQIDPMAHTGGIPNPHAVIPNENNDILNDPLGMKQRPATGNHQSLSLMPQAPPQKSMGAAELEFNKQNPPETRFQRAARLTPTNAYEEIQQILHPAPITPVASAPMRLQGPATPQQTSANTHIDPQSWLSAATGSDETPGMRRATVSEEQQLKQRDEGFGPVGVAAGPRKAVGQIQTGSANLAAGTGAAAVNAEYDRLARLFPNDSAAELDSQARMNVARRGTGNPDWDRAALGATQMMSGGMTLATPFAASGIAAAPVRGAIEYGVGILSGKAASEVAQRMGATPNEVNFYQTAGFFIPTTLASITGVRSFTETQGQTQRAGVSAFGGRVKAEVASNPDAVGVAGQVGPYKAGWAKARDRGVQVSDNVPTGLPGGSEQPQPMPQDATAIQQRAQSATVAETAANAAEINLKAAQMVGMAPPPPPPPKPGEPGSKQLPPPAGIEQGHISQQVMSDLGASIMQLPPEVHPKAVLEATGKLAKVMFDAKTFIGPDGKVVNVDSQKAAQTEAVNLVNDQVEKRKQEAEDAAKAQQEQQDAQKKIVEQQAKDAEAAAKEREKARLEAEKNQPPPPIPDNPVTQAIRASLEKLPVSTKKADVIFAVRKTGAAAGRLIPEKLASQFYDELVAKRAQQEDSASAGITGEKVNHDQNPIALGRMANDVQQGKTAFLHVQPGTKFKPTGLTKETGFISTKVDKAQDSTFNGIYFHPAEIKSKDVKAAASGEAPLAHLRGLEAGWKAGKSPAQEPEAQGRAVLADSAEQTQLGNPKTETKSVKSETKPIRAYHGTSAKFEGVPRTSGMGAHFTPDQKLAKEFSKGSSGRESGRVIEADLNIKNPLRIKDHGFPHSDAAETVKDLVKQGVLPDTFLKDLDTRIIQRSREIQRSGDITPNDAWLQANNEDLEKVKTYLQSQGYDGLVYENTLEGGGDSYVAFSPEQIEPVKAAVVSLSPEAATGLNTYEAEVSKYAGDPHPKMVQVQAENRRHAEQLLADKHPGMKISSAGRVETALAAEKPVTFKPGDKVTIKNADGTSKPDEVRVVLPNNKLVLKGQRKPVKVEDVSPAETAEEVEPKVGDTVTVHLGGRDWPNTTVTNVANGKYGVDVMGFKYVDRGDIISVTPKKLKAPVVDEAYEQAKTARLARDIDSLQEHNAAGPGEDITIGSAQPETGSQRADIERTLRRYQEKGKPAIIEGDQLIIPDGRYQMRWEDGRLVIGKIHDLAKAGWESVLDRSGIEKQDRWTSFNKAAKEEFETRSKGKAEREATAKTETDAKQEAYKKESARTAELQARFTAEMRNELKAAQFKPTTFTPQGPKGARPPIKGEGLNGLVAHKSIVNKGTYDISHAASGLVAGHNFTNLENAKIGALRMQRLADWTKDVEALKADKGLFDKAGQLVNTMRGSGATAMTAEDRAEMDAKPAPEVPKFVKIMQERRGIAPVPAAVVKAESKAVAPGTDGPAVHEEQVAKLAELDKKIEENKARVSELRTLIDKKTSYGRTKDKDLDGVTRKEVIAARKEVEFLKESVNDWDGGRLKEAADSLRRSIKIHDDEVESTARREALPLTEPEDKIVTDPDQNKWKYQGEYFMKALEPVRDAWLEKYEMMPHINGVLDWKGVVKNSENLKKPEHRPEKYPDDFIRIEVPGDGKFLVKNTPDAIDRILRGAPSAFAKPGKTPGQTPRSVPRAPKEIDAQKMRDYLESRLDEAKQDMARAEGEEKDFHKQEVADLEKQIEELKRPPEVEYLHGGMGAVFSPEALKKAIENAPAPVHELITGAQTEYANVRKSRSLQSGLYDLDSQANADVIRAKRFMESVPGDANDFEAVYHHIEDPALPLTELQQKILDDYIRPLMASTTETVKEMRDAGAETDASYVHRIVMDRGGFIDRLMAGSKSTGKGNVLKTKVPSQKSRTMMAVENPEGERFVVSIKGNRVTAFVDGKPMDLGGLRNGLSTKLDEISPRLDPIAENILDTQAEIDGTHEAERQRQIESTEKQIERRQRDQGVLSSVKGRVPGQYAAHGVEPSFGKRAGLTREIDALEKQLEALKADTAPVTAHETAALKRLNKRLAGLEADREAILDQVPTEHLADEIWKDKNGQEWKITQATTKEIEAQTDIKYYHNALGSAIINWLAVEKQARAVRFLDKLKSSPDFPTIAVPIAETNGAPEGWKTTQLAQMRSYYFEPHSAEVLDWYNDRLKSGAPGVFEKINEFLVSSIFFNPLLHVPNIANHWFVEKGLSGWLDPRNKVSQFKAGLKAIDAVMHQNDDFLKALDAGGALKSQQFETRKFAETFLDKMQKELEGDPTAGQRIANALGYANPLKWLEAVKGVSSRVTWYSNDIAFLQSAYEKTAHGMDLETALRETAKHIPDYRMPTRIFDSKGLESFLANKNLVMFMNYHYGAVKSYGETIKSVLGIDGQGKGMGSEEPSGTDYSHENAKGKPVNAAGRTREQERMHGLDILAALGFVTFILYPLMDQFLKKATGDKNAQARRAGASTVPYNLIQVAQGEKSPWDAIQSTVTPGVTAKLALESAMNRDLRTGKQIYSWPPVDAKTFATQTGEKLVGSFGPAAAVQGAHNFGTAKQLWGMAGVSFPQHGGERIATEIAQAKAGSEALTPDAKKRMQAHYAALDALRAGDGQKAREEMDKAGLNAKQQYALRKEADADPLLVRVKAFTMDELKTVYQYSTPEEKMRLGPFMRDKEEKEHRKNIGLGIKTAQ